MYVATLPAALLQQGTQLYVGTAVRDFASIYIDGRPIARIDRTTAHDALAVNLSTSVDHVAVDRRMHVVVEAMGHNTFFDAVSYPNGAFDLKGLVRPLTLNGVPLTNWTVYPLHLGEGLPLLPWHSQGHELLSNASAPPAPALLRFQFWVDPQRKGLYEAHPPDTYLALHGWGKGVAFVNNFNLGWCVYFGAFLWNSLWCQLLVNGWSTAGQRQLLHCCPAPAPCMQVLGQ